MDDNKTLIPKSHEQAIELIQRRQSMILESLRRQSESVVKSGANALDLIQGSPVSESSLVKAKILLEQNFGTEYAPEKWLMLVELMDEEKWTEDRFQRTLKW